VEKSCGCAVVAVTDNNARRSSASTTPAKLELNDEAKDFDNTSNLD
jgi:hypothetical protein